MKGFLHVDTFKKKYEITQAQLNELERNMVVEIVQTGYYGHSLMHPRAVVFDPKTIKEALNLDSWPEPDWRYRCLGNLKTNLCLMGFEKKSELEEHQEETRHSGWEPSTEAKATIKYMKKIRGLRT